MQWRRRDGKCKGNGDRLIEASEKKGGDGVHSIRKLLSDCCWDCGAEGKDNSSRWPCRVVRTVR